MEHRRRRPAETDWLVGNQFAGRPCGQHFTLIWALFALNAILLFSFALPENFREYLHDFRRRYPIRSARSESYSS